MLPDQNPLPDSSHDVQVLYELIGKLPEKQREAFVLFELSGFSLEEIRQLQGGTLSSIKMRLSRGRKQLRLWLENPSVNIEWTHNCVHSDPGKEELE
jgi:RNA polymerase sigma-70 factor (ECF subfamily)